MLKKLFIPGLLTYAAVAFSAPHFPLKNNLDKQGGEAKILTRIDQLSFQNETLFLGGLTNELQLTLTDWRGESGSVIFDFQPVDWTGQKTEENVVFLKSIDGSDGNFFLYKYPQISGIWLLTQAKLPEGKVNNQFPVMDREALANCKAGEWQHLAMVWKRGEFVKIYLNGRQAGAAAGTSFFPADFTIIAIGNNTSVAAKHQTRIKDLTFERRPLTDAEIKLNYDQSRQSPPPAAKGSIPQANQL